MGKEVTIKTMSPQRKDETVINAATSATTQSYKVGTTREVLVEAYGSSNTAIVTIKAVYPSGAEVDKKVIIDGDFSLKDGLATGQATRITVSGFRELKITASGMTGGSTVSVLVREVE